MAGVRCVYQIMAGVRCVYLIMACVERCVH